MALPVYYWNFETLSLFLSLSLLLAHSFVIQKSKKINILKILSWNKIIIWWYLVHAYAMCVVRSAVWLELMFSFIISLMCKIINIRGFLLMDRNWLFSIKLKAKEKKRNLILGSFVIIKFLNKKFNLIFSLVCFMLKWK